MIALKLLNKSRFLSFKFNLLPKQLIHSTAVICNKKVHESEFKFFNKFILSIKEIENDFENTKKGFEICENLNENSSKERVNEFESLSNRCDSSKTWKTDEKFDALIYRLIEILPNCRDDQLVKILNILQKIPTNKSVGELCSRLDDICYERGRNWSQSMLLTICSLWFKLDMHSKFIEGALTKLRRGFNKLPKDIFIGTLFYLTVCRREVPLTFIEHRFIEHFDELTSNEIGIFCLSLYKNESWIKNTEVVDKLYDKAITEIDSIEEIALQNFLKQLRLSSEPMHLTKLNALCEILLPRIEKYDLKTCLHIGLLGTNSQFCHQQLVEAVLRRFNNDIENAIVKNFPELTYILGLFNFKSESGVEKELIARIVSELKLRVDEVIRVPNCLAITMNNLTMCGVYDTEIIEAILSQKFIKFTYGEIENLNRYKKFFIFRFLQESKDLALDLKFSALTVTREST